MRCAVVLYSSCGLLTRLLCLRSVLPSTANVAYKKARPNVSANFVAPSATVVGQVPYDELYHTTHCRMHNTITHNAMLVVICQVSIGKNSSVWYGATVRGDVNGVTIGENTIISDRVVVHVQIGSASCRERVCKCVEILVVVVK